MRSYSTRLHERVRDLQTSALVGLDPRWDLLPDEIKAEAESRGGNNVEQQARGFTRFCCEIIDIVAPLVPAVKPQIAFFEQLGPPGLAAVQGSFNTLEMRI